MALFVSEHVVCSHIDTHPAAPSGGGFLRRGPNFNAANATAGGKVDVADISTADDQYDDGNRSESDAESVHLPENVAKTENVGAENVGAGAFELGTALAILDETSVSKGSGILDEVASSLGRALATAEEKFATATESVDLNSNVLEWHAKHPKCAIQSGLDTPEDVKEALLGNVRCKFQAAFGNGSDQLGRCRAGYFSGMSAESCKDISLKNGDWLHQALSTRIGNTDSKHSVPAWEHRLTKVKAIAEFGSVVSFNLMQNCRDPEATHTSGKPCYRDIPKYLAEIGVHNASDLFATFETHEIASAAFQKNRTRWERVPTALQHWFDAATFDELERRHELVYRDLDNNDVNYVVQWESVEQAAAVGALDMETYDRVMDQLTKNWDEVRDERTHFVRAARETAAKKNLSATETPIEDIENFWSQEVAKKLAGLGGKRVQKENDNVPERTGAPQMDFEGSMPLRPGVLSDDAFKALDSCPQFRAFQQLGFIGTVQDHEYAHGTAVNRWDVRPGAYGGSVVAAGGVVAGAHSAGTAYTLFGAALLKNNRGNLLENDIYAMGLYAFAFMTFGGYHTALETFPIVQSLASGEAFCDKSRGPVFDGVAEIVYVDILKQIEDQMSQKVSIQVEKLLGAYEAALAPSDRLWKYNNAKIVQAVKNNQPRELPYEAILRHSHRAVCRESFDPEFA